MAVLTETIGNTPLVALARMCRRPGVRLLAKLEGTNPGGSIKDRPALSMIEGAEARGELSAGTRIIEPTSGNTGIALAMIACAKGYELELVMPEGATAERVATMRAYGATVTLTPHDLGMEGSIDHARQLVARGGAIMLDQFSNPDNWRAHYRTTGPEIWRDTGGTVTHFVSAMGTTGTIMGTSRFLKEHEPAVTIVGVQPMDGAKIPGIRRWPEAYLPRIFERERVDRLVDISQEEAESTARRLARVEGVFAGVSSGGAVAAALRIAEELERGVIVVIICDRGDRYLSSGLFDGGSTA
ncbi:MAG: cysteine synthase CysM [Polyangiaceae bacterium]|nr:cysteine synthase CysM [Polyangiaceae bacterium]